MLAIDGSEYSVRATQYAISLAEKYGGKIDVVHVVGRDESKNEVLHHAEKLTLEEWHREQITDIEKLLQTSHLNYETHILYGNIAQTLLNFVDENQSDCVVIGSRGLNNFQTFLLGSVSHKVAKRANCPVLIVK